MIATLFGRKTAGHRPAVLRRPRSAPASPARWSSSSSRPSVRPASWRCRPPFWPASGSLVAVRLKSRLVPVGGVLAAGLVVCVVASGVLPDVRTDDDKGDRAGDMFSEWSPIFRVDVVDPGNGLLLLHDGLLGSVIKKWDGDVASLGGESFNFDHDPRSFPFDLMGAPTRERHDHRRRRRSRDPGLALLRGREHRRDRAQPADLRPGHRPVRRLRRSPRRPAGGQLRQRRRPVLPRPQRRRLQPDLVPGARQLLGDQRRHGRGVRALRELPLHDARPSRTASTT